MKKQAFNGKDSIEFINFLTQCKRACNSSRIQGGAALWLFSEVMNGPAAVAINARLNLSSNDANRHAGTIKTYSEVVNQLLAYYTTDAVIAKANEEIRNF